MPRCHIRAYLCPQLYVHAPGFLTLPAGITLQSSAPCQVDALLFAEDESPAPARADEHARAPNSPGPGPGAQAANEGAAGLVDFPMLVAPSSPALAALAALTAPIALPRLP
jgi:hypothetical protein